MDLYKLWKITPNELSQAIVENPSLRGMVFGYVAEIKLREYIDANPSVEWSKKDDDHDRKKREIGDFLIRVKNSL